MLKHLLALLYLLFLTLGDLAKYKCILGVHDSKHFIMRQWNILKSKYRTQGFFFQ